MCFTETPHPPALSSSPTGGTNTSEEKLFNLSQRSFYILPFVSHPIQNQ